MPATVTGPMTRRYHAPLVAALPVPFGRTVMLDLLVETLHRPDGQSMHLGAPQIAASQRDHGNLTEFRLEQGLPVWRFEADGLTVERRAVLLHRQNTLVLNWHLVGAAFGHASYPPLRPFPLA